MLRPTKAGTAAGVITLALASPAFAQFLPDEATYDGKTNHGGDLFFRVHNSRIIRIKGHIPLPKGGSCSYADERRVPINFKENDPVESGPFKIDATSRRNPHTPEWQRLKLHMSGQFDSDAEHAHGAIRVKVYDRDGKCLTRPDLEWHVHRSG
jgi:hypothetical protein